MIYFFRAFFHSVDPYLIKDLSPLILLQKVALPCTTTRGCTLNIAGTALFSTTDTSAP